MPPTGLLDAKKSVYNVPKNTGCVLKKGESKSVNNDPNWSKKNINGRQSITQNLIVPKLWEWCRKIHAVAIHAIMNDKIEDTA